MSPLTSHGVMVDGMFGFFFLNFFQKKSDHPPSQTGGLLAPFGRSGRIFKHATILDRGTDPNHRSKTGWNGCIQTCSGQVGWVQSFVPFFNSRTNPAALASRCFWLFLSFSIIWMSLEPTITPSASALQIS